MDEKTLAERLQSEMQRNHLRMADVAKGAGLTSGAVSQLLHGITKTLKIENAIRIAKVLDCDPIWLMTGEEVSRPVQAYDEDDDTPPAGMVAIKQYRVSCQAGYGAPDPTYEEEHEARAVWYHMSFFQRLGVNPNKCCRLKVSGDSMSPLINDGDYILVDRTEGQPIIDGEIYAFVQSPGGIRVKRVFKPMRGGIIIHSDNERYPDEAYDDDTQVNFKLIGRVLERSGAIV